MTRAPTSCARATIAAASMMYDVRNSTCENATTAVCSSIASSIRSVCTVRSARRARRAARSRPPAARGRDRPSTENPSPSRRCGDAPLVGRRHDSATMCAVVTFSCMLTVLGGAPMIRAILSPTSSAISHQRSSQPRTPRVAHVRRTRRGSRRLPRHRAERVADHVDGCARESETRRATWSNRQVARSASSLPAQIEGLISRSHEGTRSATKKYLYKCASCSFVPS